MILARILLAELGNLACRMFPTRCTIVEHAHLEPAPCPSCCYTDNGYCDCECHLLTAARLEADGAQRKPNPLK